MDAHQTIAKLDASDLLDAASICHRALEPGLAADWDARAGDLEWSCRRTIDHLADALLFYAAHLSTRATVRRPHLRNGDPARSPAELLIVIETAATVLAEVVRAAPPGTRAFHPAGMADPEGFVAMGCEEILIHTDDIAQGLGLDVRPPDALAARVLARLFPWAPTDVEPWAALRWASGRIALPDRERLDPNWYWQCAPLSEWDGTIMRRAAPPAWT